MGKKLLLWSLCLLGTLSAEELAFTTSNCEMLTMTNKELSQRLLNRIAEEKESVHLALYDPVPWKLWQALSEAIDRKVIVEVILLPKACKSPRMLAHCEKHELPVYVWAPQQARLQVRSYLRTPNRYVIFGQKEVWSGTFSLTGSSKQALTESTLILKNSDIAKGFQRQFSAVKALGCIPLEQFLSTKGEKPPKVSSIKRDPKRLESTVP